MQSILSIDLSTEPAHAVVLTIDGKDIQVIERHSVNLGNYLKKLLSESLENAEQPVVESTEENSEDSLDTESPTEATTTVVDTSPLVSLLKKVESHWTNAILVVPGHNYVSVNLELPFGNNRNLSKILELEVQDLVPFDVADFLVAHKSIAQINNGSETNPNFDIHAGIIPRDFIRSIIKECKQASFEPIIVTTPTSILGAVYLLAPQYFAENSAVIFESLPSYYILTCVDGLVRGDRTLIHSSFAPTNNGNAVPSLENAGKILLRDLKLSLASTERRYNKTLDKVYFIGSQFSASELQQTLGRHVESVTVNELIPTEEHSESIATLAAVFGQDDNVNQILNNFRVREFSYSPQLKELFRGARALAPYALAFFASLFIYLVCSYGISSYHISRITSAMTSQIRTAIPTLQSEPGKELVALQIENQKLEEQLKDVSSLTTLTPIDLLAEISKDIKSVAKVNITAIKIKDNKIVVEGSAQSYEEVDKLQRVLQKKPLYERIKKGEHTGFTTSTGTRPFSFEVWIKE